MSTACIPNRSVKNSQAVSKRLQRDVANATRVAPVQFHVDFIRLRQMPSEDIVRSSAVEVRSRHAQSLGGVPIVDGLMSPHTGATGNFLCLGCLNSAGSHRCTGHHGHIKLSVLYMHTIHARRVVTTLSCVCIGCSAPLYRAIPAEYEELKAQLKSAAAGQALKLCEKRCTVRMRKCEVCGLAQQPKYVLVNADLEIETQWGKRCKWASPQQKTEMTKSFTLEWALAVMQGIAPDVWAELGYAHDVQPSSLIVDTLMVPSVNTRPPVMSGGKVQGMHPTTTRLMHVMVPEKNLQFIKEVEEMGSVEKFVKARYTDTMTISAMAEMVNDLKAKLASSSATWDFNVKDLRASAAMLVQVGAKMKTLQRRGRPNTAADAMGGDLNRIISGKQGHVRRHGSGRVCGGVGRLPVVAADPSIGIHQAGVPECVLIELTKPITVRDSPHDIVRKKLQQCIRVGAFKLGGANFIQMTSTSSVEHITLLDLAQRERLALSLPVGAVVHVVLGEGDGVLINRQPTLGPSNIMWHEIRVIPSKDRRRPRRKFSRSVDMRQYGYGVAPLHMNPSVTNAYHLDFDGDEQTVHCLVDTNAIAEAQEIMAVRMNIIDPTSSSPLIFPVHNVPGAIHTITMPDAATWSYEDATQYLMYASNFMDVADMLDGLRPVSADGVPLALFHDAPVSGHQIVSAVLPRGFCMNTRGVTVLDGRILPQSGPVTDKVIRGSGGLIHCVYNALGGEAATVFINAISAVGEHMAVAVVPSGCAEQIATEHQMDVSEEVAARVRAKAAEAAEVTRNMAPSERERVLHMLLSSVQGALVRVTDAQLPLYHPLRQLTWGKGNMSQVTRMLTGVGGCFVDQRRPGIMRDGTTSLNHSLCFKDTDVTDMEAHGYVPSGLGHSRKMFGVKMHTVKSMMEESRENLVGIADTTPQTGTLQRQACIGAADATITHGINITRPVQFRILADHSQLRQIVQFTYGGNGMDTRNVIPVTVEALRVDNDVFAAEMEGAGDVAELGARIRTRFMTTLASQPTVSNRDVYRVPMAFNMANEMQQARMRSRGADDITTDALPLVGELLDALIVAGADETSVEREQAALHLLDVIWELRPKATAGGLSAAVVKTMARELGQRFHMSLVEAGTAGGMLAACGVCAVNTQMTLDAFHPGNPNMDQNATSLMTGYITGREHFIRPRVTVLMKRGTNELEARSTAFILQPVLLKELLAETVFMGDASTFTDVETEAWRRWWTLTRDTPRDDEAYVSVVRMNALLCNRTKGLCIEDVYGSLQAAVTVKASGASVIPCGSRGETWTFIVYADDWTKHTAALNAAVEDAEIVAAEMALWLNSGKQVVRDGVKGTKLVTVTMVSQQTADVARGALVCEERWQLTLTGPKMMDVMRNDVMDKCDASTLMTTDVNEVNQHFGVEAATSAWCRTMMNLCGGGMSPTHIAILADAVFASGKFEPLTPQATTGSGFYAAMAHRKPLETIAVASTAGTRDYLFNMGAQMMGAACRNVGTTCCDVRMEPEYAQAFAEQFVRAEMVDKEEMGVEGLEDEEELVVDELDDEELAVDELDDEELVVGGLSDDEDALAVHDGLPTGASPSEFTKVAVSNVQVRKGVKTVPTPFLPHNTKMTDFVDTADVAPDVNVHMTVGTKYAAVNRIINMGVPRESQSVGASIDDAAEEEAREVATARFRQEASDMALTIEQRTSAVTNVMQHKARGRQRQSTNRTVVIKMVNGVVKKTPSARSALNIMSPRVIEMSPPPEKAPSVMPMSTTRAPPPKKKPTKEKKTKKVSTMKMLFM